MMPIAEKQVNPYVQISYICINIDPEMYSGARAGGSGQQRMWLNELPGWLMRNAGAMVVRIEEI